VIKFDHHHPRWRRCIPQTDTDKIRPVLSCHCHRQRPILTARSRETNHTSIVHYYPPTKGGVASKRDLTSIFNRMMMLSVLVRFGLVWWWFLSDREQQQIQFDCNLFGNSNSIGISTSIDIAASASASGTDIDIRNRHRNRHRHRHRPCPRDRDVSERCGIGRVGRYSRSQDAMVQ